MHQSIARIILAAAVVMPFAAHAHIVVVESASPSKSFIQTSEPGEDSAEPAVKRAMDLCHDGAKGCKLKLSKVSGLAVTAQGQKGDKVVYGKHALGTDPAAVRKEAVANCAKVAPRNTCVPVFVTWSGPVGEKRPTAVEVLAEEADANITAFTELMKKQVTDALAAMQR